VVDQANIVIIGGGAVGCESAATKPFGFMLFYPGPGGRLPAVLCGGIRECGT